MTVNHQGVRACKHCWISQVALGGLMELLLEYFVKVDSFHFFFFLFLFLNWELEFNLRFVEGKNKQMKKKWEIL